ncbi:MAG: hypothetical protein ABH983_01115 [Candidatus Micrarchaeota archaeon]
MRNSCTSRVDDVRFRRSAWTFFTNLRQSSAENFRKKKEPLAEGLQAVPRDSRGRRAWKEMSDAEIVEYARKLMEETGISRRRELKMADCGLYTIIYGRRLSSRIGFEEKRRKSRTWKDMNDEEIVGYAKKFVEEKEITRRNELKDADCGLYSILKRRGLLDEIGFAERPKRRSWKDISDEEIVGYVREFIMERGITARGELQGVDCALYNVLERRELLDEIGFETKLRSWKNICDKKIVEFARKLMETNGISGKKELEKADRGLYCILHKRGLLDEVGFEEKLRSWSGISDEEIIEYTRKLMEEKGANSRGGLRSLDEGLYTTLYRRGLLDCVFAHVDQQKTDNARDAVIDALTKYSVSDNTKLEGEVA